jgi:lipopolysaccharide export system permease protein
VWLTQSLRYLDIVIEEGRTFAVFIALTFLALPTFVAIILPFAFLLGLLFALYRLASESELTAMAATGFGRRHLLTPLISLAVIASLLLYALSMFAGPAAYRSLKHEIWEMRTDLAAGLVRPGEFTSPAEGLTLYTRSVVGAQRMQDLLLHDARDPREEAIYLAREAVLTYDGEGPRLLMRDGSLQRRGASGSIDILTFDDYAFDLSRFAEESGMRDLEPRERFLHELLDPGETEYAERFRADLLAEAHSRLAGPLYMLVMSALGLFAVARTGGNRRDLAGVFFGCLGAGFAVRLVGLILETRVAEDASWAPAVYAWPTAVLAVALLVIWRVDKHRRNDSQERAWTGEVVKAS